MSNTTENPYTTAHAFLENTVYSTLAIAQKGSDWEMVFKGFKDFHLWVGISFAVFMAIRTFWYLKHRARNTRSMIPDGSAHFQLVTRRGSPLPDIDKDGGRELSHRTIIRKFKENENDEGRDNNSFEEFIEMLTPQINVRKKLQRRTSTCRVMPPLEEDVQVTFKMTREQLGGDTMHGFEENANYDDVPVMI